MALSELEQIRQTINQARHVLITFRKDATVDAISGALALALVLRKMNKLVDVTGDGFQLPANLAFLPGADRITGRLANLQKLIISLHNSRDNVDQWKAAHATDTPLRTMAEAMVGADVVLGLSAKGAITKEMVASMAPNPIIFAMANPDPEITPEDVKSVRSDAIIATGRSDYVNQVNNVLAFPYLFRGALDVRARRVNHEMKVACAQALAALAREDVPDEVAAAYRGRKLKFGPDYIIPTPFDPRLIWYIPPFIAQAAMDTGVARVQIEDMDVYRNALRSRVDPSAALMQKTKAKVDGWNKILDKKYPRK